MLPAHASKVVSLESDYTSSLWPSALARGVGAIRHHKSSRMRGCSRNSITMRCRVGVVLGPGVEIQVYLKGRGVVWVRMWACAVSLVESDQSNT